MSELQRILEANEAYASKLGDKANLTVPPLRHVAIVTCMDARMDPEKLAGLEEGDAHIIRNAGGRVSDDALRSLIISHRLLGTREFYVIQHTDCGVQRFSNEQLRERLKRETGSDAAEQIDFLPFSDLDTSVVDDVRRIREHPLIAGDVTIYGMVYDVKTGRLREVPGASEAGKPKVSA